jgi:hypothetical protein
VIVIVRDYTVTINIVILIVGYHVVIVSGVVVAISNIRRRTDHRATVDHQPFFTSIYHIYTEIVRMSNSSFVVDTRRIADWTT